jgi:hypothetical protein
VIQIQRNIKPLIQAKNELKFGSLSEYAVGISIEKYVEGFQLEMGKTMQIDIGGNGRTCDFRIEGAFFEFHPIVLKREFRDSKAFREIWCAIKRTKEPERGHIIEALISEFSEQYYIKRKNLIEAKFGTGNELILATSVEQFRTKVLKRYGEGVPKEQEFRREFDKICREHLKRK